MMTIMYDVFDDRYKTYTRLSTKCESWKVHDNAIMITQARIIWLYKYTDIVHKNNL